MPGAILIFILILILAFFGLDLFKPGENPFDAAATSSPTPTTAGPSPTPEEDVVETPAHTFPVRQYQLDGEVDGSNGIALPRDAISSVKLLIGHQGIKVELHLDIEQLVDLDDLGGDAEASDVVCATIDLGPTPWLKVKRGPDDQLHAKGQVDLEIGYTEDECTGDTPDDVEDRTGAVDLTVSADDTADGTVRIGTATLEFSADRLEVR